MKRMYEITKRQARPAVGLAVSMALAAAFLIVAPMAVSGNPELSGEARQELAAARAATAKYQNIEAALADGYVDLNFCMPQMGYHYGRFDLLDGFFDPAQPEILVYAPSPTARKMRLVALEYAVPLEEGVGPPEGFSGPFDYWNEDLGFGLWTLHAWTWLQNPEGIFAPSNPRLSVSCE